MKRVVIFASFAFLILLLPLTNVNSQELREMQYKELPADHIILDDASRSLLIVETTISKPKFSSNRGIKPGAVKEDQSGVWYIYLEPGVQLISIMADGYLPIQDLRFNFVPRGAIKLKVTPKVLLGAYGGFDENRPEISLLYTPSSSEEKIYGGLNGNVMRLDFSAGSRTFRPAAGKHIIKLNADGLVWEKSYDLGEGESIEDEVVFKGNQIEKWDVKEPGNLYITTNPQGGTVFMNQVNQGVTPLTLEDVQPGVYNIEIIRDLYLGDSRSVEVKSLEYSEVHFDLTPNFGQVKIDTDPPEAMVWINDKQKGRTPFEALQFNAGTYALRLVQDFYYEETDTFKIEPGSKFIKSYELKPQFGKVTITSEPSGADVVVDGVAWGKTPVMREKVLSGEHVVNLQLENYFPEEATLRVRDGQHAEPVYKLRPSVGWLTVTSDPPDAVVTLVEGNQDLGRTPIINVPLDRGNYTLQIEKDKYEIYERAVGLTLGGHQTVEAELVRQVGHMRVSTEPQGAKIYLNDEYRGDTPTVVQDLPTGSYNIRLDKSDHDIHIGQVTVTRNEVTKYNTPLVTVGMTEWNKRRWKAKLLSIVVPGGGHILCGQYYRGSLYMGVFAGAAAMAYLSIQDHADYKTQYDDAMTAYNASYLQSDIDTYRAETLKALDNMNDAQTLTNIFISTAAVIYAGQLVDMMFFGGGKRPIAKSNSLSANLIPQLYASGQSGKSVLGLRWSIPLEQGNRNDK
ncbi:MAG: PEGA domain-containing protein [Candidatus Hatepunaea meridiana]|nr:PEGA domain-containing protein [Candidatus Hatepunaea meridiana]